MRETRNFPPLQPHGALHLECVTNTPFFNHVLKISQLDTKDVCTGFMGLEGPILAATLRNMIIPTRTSTLFCNVLFGLCDIPAVSNFTVPFPKPKPKSCRPALSGEKPIQVVHISDVHVDLSYEVGSNYNCTVSLSFFTKVD